MKKIISSLFIIWLGFATVGAQGAQNAESLNQYFLQTEDMQADFKQNVYGNHDSETEGHVWLKKPNKFYWDYGSPEQQRIISDGKFVYQYDVDLEQISVRSRDELVGDVAVRVLSGEVPLSSIFDIKMTSYNVIPQVLGTFGNSAQYYQLISKEEAETYDQLWLVMSDNELKAIMIDVGRGQQTVLVFNNLKRNQGISDSVFEFTPPEGIDVIGDVR